MRIIAGRWAGRSLVSPGDRIRPSAEGLRALALELVAHEVADARVLDLFAGTGAFGLEALSRGARSCDFVENHPAALHSLKANVSALRVRENTRIFKRDAIPFVEQLAERSYDLTFIDPPYGSRKLERVLASWQQTHFSRTLVIEHAADHAIPLRPTASRRWEDSVVSVLRM